MRRSEREIEIALWSDSDSDHLCENICMKNMFEKMATNYLAKHKNCEREKENEFWWEKCRERCLRAWWLDKL